MNAHDILNFNFAPGKLAREIDLKDARLFCLLGAMILYALFGSPTPDHPGMVEIAIALLLIFATGLPVLSSAFIPSLHNAPWRAAGQALFLFGMTVTLVTGVMHGNDPVFILRDLPALLFLLFPLLMADAFEGRPKYFQPFIAVFAFCGFMFSFRGLVETGVIGIHWPHETAELRYLANAPTVLFTSIFPLGWAVKRFIDRPAFLNLALLALMGIVAFVPAMAMAVTLQRASLAYMVLSLLIWGAVLTWQAPKRVALLALIGILLALPFHQYFFDHVMRLAGLLEHKTEIYGINKREMEMASVWDAVGGNPFTILFGLGWGGTFESPAVGGVRVNYTHFLFSGAVLKSGLIGLFLTIVYVAGLCRPLATVVNRNLLLGLAVAGPFAIDVLLYASYKWLDFGLLLLLIVVAARNAKPSAVASPRGLLYSEQ